MIFEQGRRSIMEHRLCSIVLLLAGLAVIGGNDIIDHYLQNIEGFNSQGESFFFRNIAALSLPINFNNSSPISPSLYLKTKRDCELIDTSANYKWEDVLTCIHHQCRQETEPLNSALFGKYVVNHSNLIDNLFKYYALPNADFHAVIYHQLLMHNMAPFFVLDLHKDKIILRDPLELISILTGKLSNPEILRRTTETIWNSIHSHTIDTTGFILDFFDKKTFNARLKVLQDFLIQLSASIQSHPYFISNLKYGIYNSSPIAHQVNESNAHVPGSPLYYTTKFQALQDAYVEMFSWTKLLSLMDYSSLFFKREGWEKGEEFVYRKIETHNIQMTSLVHSILENLSSFFFQSQVKSKRTFVLDVSLVLYSLFTLHRWDSSLAPHTLWDVRASCSLESLHLQPLYYSTLLDKWYQKKSGDEDLSDAFVVVEDGEGNSSISQKIKKVSNELLKEIENEVYEDNFDMELIDSVEEEELFYGVLPGDETLQFQEDPSFLQYLSSLLNEDLNQGEIFPWDRDMKKVKELYALLVEQVRNHYGSKLPTYTRHFEAVSMNFLHLPSTVTKVSEFKRWVERSYEEHAYRPATSPIEFFQQFTYRPSKPFFSDLILPPSWEESDPITFLRGGIPKAKRMRKIASISTTNETRGSIPEEPSREGEGKIEYNEWQIVKDWEPKEKDGALKLLDDNFDIEEFYKGKNSRADNFLSSTFKLYAEVLKDQVNGLYNNIQTFMKAEEPVEISRVVKKGYWVASQAALISTIPLFVFPFFQNRSSIIIEQSRGKDQALTYDYLSNTVYLSHKCLFLLHKNEKKRKEAAVSSTQKKLSGNRSNNEKNIFEEILDSHIVALIEDSLDVLLPLSHKVNKVLFQLFVTQPLDKKSYIHTTISIKVNRKFTEQQFHFLTTYLFSLERVLDLVEAKFRNNLLRHKIDSPNKQKPFLNLFLFFFVSQWKHKSFDSFYSQLMPEDMDSLSQQRVIIFEYIVKNLNLYKSQMSENISFITV